MAKGEKIAGKYYSYNTLQQIGKGLEATEKINIIRKAKGIKEIRF